MKKILITGANSYIGMSFEKYMSQWPEKYQVDTVDMIDGTWREKDFSGYDCVYHVAGIAHSDSGKISPEKAKLYYAVNTDLTVETAKKAKTEGVKQFIFMSSAIVYGESAPIGKSKVITKDTPVSPANSYGDSKVQAEKGILPLSDDSFKVVIIRPPMIYGPGSKGNYPVLSKLARKLPVFPVVNNCRSMLYMLKRTIMLHSYILVPMFVGMLVCAEPLIVVIFSEKWLPSVPYLQIFCLTYLLEGMGIANQNAVKAVGYSGLSLKIECIKTPMYIIILLATIPFGVMAIAWGVVVGVLIAEIICAWPSKKLFNYSVFQQLADMTPNLLLSAFMGICVWTITLLNLSPAVTLLIQVPAGVAIYLLGSMVLKLESYYYVLKQIKPVLSKLTGKLKPRK